MALTFAVDIDAMVVVRMVEKCEKELKYGYFLVDEVGISYSSSLSYRGPRFQILSVRQRREILVAIPTPVVDGLVTHEGQNVVRESKHAL